jgi:hypothetical protein
MSNHIPYDNARSILGLEICKALNLDVNRVVRLELVIEAGSIPVLNITLALFGDDCNGPLAGVFEQYELTPKASAPLVDIQASTGSN